MIKVKNKKLYVRHPVIAIPGLPFFNIDDVPRRHVPTSCRNDFLQEASQLPPLPPRAIPPYGPLECSGGVFGVAPPIGHPAPHASLIVEHGGRFVAGGVTTVD